MDRIINIDEFQLRISQKFEMNNKVYEFMNTDNNNDSDMINCKVIESNNL